MEIVKNFLGGLNTDDSIDFFPDGDYSYLENGIIGKTYNGKTGVLENIMGQSSAEAVAGSDYVLIGVIRSPKDGVNYLFYENTGDPALDTIIKQDGDSFSVVIESEFLDFANAEINGGGVVNDLLYYSDGNDPKCVHLTRYNVTPPDSQEEILLMKRGPQSRPTYAFDLDGPEDLVRFSDWQFAYLYVYFDGQTSVLSPYSDMARATLNSKEYNKITVTLPSGDEPVLAKEKRLYVKKGNDGTFTEVGSVTRTTPGGAFSGSTIDFNGKTNGYVLETNYTKQFELVPPWVKTMCVAGNRTWLANYITGYDRYTGAITINAGTTIEEFTSGADGDECVAGNSSYKYGFILKDNQGRASSVITTPEYFVRGGNFISDDPADQAGYGIVNFDVSLASLPSWCTIVSIVITKDTVKDSYAYGETIDFDYYIVDPLGTDSTVKTYADTVTYLRIQVGTSIIDNGVGFLPQEGDIVSFTQSDGEEINLRIESYDTDTKEIFCAAYDIGTIAATDVRIIQVYRPKSVDEIAFYEFGADMTVSVGAASGQFTFTDSIYSKANKIPDPPVEVFPGGAIADAGDFAEFSIINTATDPASDIIYSAGQACFSIADTEAGDLSDTLYDTGITPGQVYNLSIEVTFVDNASRYYLVWMDGSNAVLSSSDYPATTGTKTHTLTAPTSSARLGIYFSRTTTATVAEFYIGTFSVSYTPPYALIPVMFIRDSSGIWNTDHGRIFVTSPVEGVDKKTYFKHSSPFIVGANVNGLSEFSVGDESYVSIDAYEIQKLQPTVRDSSQSSVILAICNSDTYSIYVGEARLSQGANSLFASSNVIGDVRRQQAGYGTLHPESVTEIDGQVYWWDQLARSYCRYDTNGIFPISNYKCIKYFEDQSNLNDETDLVVSGYDPFYRMIFVTFANADTTTKKTIGFSIPLNRWVSFYDFAPNAYIQGTRHVYMPDATVNNQILKLSNTTSFNTFYDNDTATRYKTKVTVPFNSPSIMEWRAFMVQCSPSLLEYSGGLQVVKDSAITVTAYNEEGQETNILWDEFQGYENQIFAALPMDSNSPATYPLINGDPLYSQTLSIDIEFGQTDVAQTHNWIKIAKAGSDLSPGHQL